MPGWRRPDGPSNVWCIVEGEEKLENDTKRKIRFSIQEVPENRQDEALQFMIKYFIPDEPISKSLKMKDDPKMIHDMSLVWKFCLQQGIVEAAYILDANGQITELAAVNMLCVITNDTEEEVHKLHDKYQSTKIIKLFKLSMELHKKADPREIFGVDRYIAAFGLTVASHLRGQKLGLRMLEARNDIGRKYDIPASSTVFTARASQILAERAGYKEEISQDYSEILDENGEPFFPNIESKCAKIMMRRLY